MTTLFLSGGGYGANWLPLIAPLLLFAILLYVGDATIKFLKKRKLRTSHPATDEITHLDVVHNHDPEN